MKPGWLTENTEAPPRSTDTRRTGFFADVPSDVPEPKKPAEEEPLKNP